MLVAEPYHDLARHGANALTAVIGFGDALPGCGAKVLERDSWAAAVVDELKQKPQDIEVDKDRLSGF